MDTPSRHYDANCPTHSQLPSRHAEPAEDTVDSALTQHASLEPPNSNTQPIIPDTQSHIGPNLATPLSPVEVTQQSELNPFLALLEDLDFDTMSYPYTRYTGSPDAESHIRSFLSNGKPTILRSASPLRRWMPPKSRNLPFC